MGLDLTHYKATRSPKDLAEAAAFDENDFDEYALDVLGFRRFIQIIPGTDYPDRIMIVKDEAALNILRAIDCAGGKEELVLLVGDPSELTQDVERIEAASGWDSARRYIYLTSYWISQNGIRFACGQVSGNSFKTLAEWTRGPTDAIREELSRNPAAVHPPVQVMSLCYPVSADYRGLYAEEVGYQRKGMSHDFYQEFGSCSHFVRLADVLRASNFLDLSGPLDEDQKRREFFHDQFIAGFEERTSIFDISY